MGSSLQSTVGCFPELCFLQFFVAQVLVGSRKQFINNFVFPTWAGAAGFNNIAIGTSLFRAKFFPDSLHSFFLAFFTCFFVILHSYFILCASVRDNTRT